MMDVTNKKSKIENSVQTIKDSVQRKQHYNVNINGLHVRVHKSGFKQIILRNVIIQSSRQTSTKQ